MKEKKKVFSLASFFKRYYKYIFLLLGVAGIVVMVIADDPANIKWDSFLEEKFPIILAECFGVWFVIYILHTITYRIILAKEGKNIDWPHLFKITMTGFALNNVTPAGLVGGEPYRIMELKKYCSTEKSASATFSFTIIYAAGHLLLWDTGFIVYLCYGMPGSDLVNILLMVTGCFNFLATFCLIFLRVNMVYPIMRFLTKLPFIGKKIAPTVEKNKEKYMEMDRMINEFRRDWFRFGIVLGIQYATRLLEAFEYFLIVRFFLSSVSDQPFNYFQGLMIMSTCSLVGNLLFIVPMQAGTREGGMDIAFHFLFDDGIISQIGTPVGLVYRFREMTCTLIGIIMVAATRRNKKAIKEANKIDKELEKAQEAKENAIDNDIVKEQITTEVSTEQTEIPEVKE